MRRPVVLSGTTIIGVAALAAFTARLMNSRPEGSAMPTAIGIAGRFARVGALASVAARGTARKGMLRIRSLAADDERRTELENDYAIRTASDVATQLGEMRGVLMKVGQMVSFMVDALPAPTRDALATLQDQAPPMAPSLAASVVTNELGAPPHELFSNWEPTPVAAASIGQVHRAVTRSGASLAVKVQYPGLEDAIGADLANTGLLYALLGRWFSSLDTESLVQEFSERILEELDYEHEGANQVEFHRLFERHPWARIPRVVPEFSSHRVLASEWVEGMSFSELIAHPSDRLRERCAEVIWRFSQHSIHRHLAFNGDPHPGNYRFHKDGTVTFLDFGMVKRWTPDEWDQLRGTLMAVIVEREPEAIRQAMIHSGFLEPSTDVDPRRIATYVSAAYEPYLVDDFQFTPQWFGDALARSAMVGASNAEITQALNIPPSFLLLNRVVWGVNAMMSKLGASGPYRSMLMEYISGTEPATELGADELEWLKATKGKQ